MTFQKLAEQFKGSLTLIPMTFVLFTLSTFEFSFMLSTAKSAPLEITWDQLTNDKNRRLRPEKVSPFLGVITGLLARPLKQPVHLINKFNGRKIKISGYPVPIHFKGFKVREFLLVPYYGACIHVPPPPHNQIIYVVTQKPIRIMHLANAITVIGYFQSVNQSTSWGNSGYQILKGIISH